MWRLLVALAMCLGALGAELPLPPGAVARLDGKGWVADVAFSTDGKYLALAMGDAVETRSGGDLAHLGSIRLPEGKRALSLAFVAPERLIVGCSDGSLLSLISSSVEKEMGAHSGRVWGLAVSPDRGLIASASEDGSIVVHALPSLDEVLRLQAHPGGAFSVAFSPNGRTLASGGKDGEIKLWEIPSGKPLGELHGHSAAVWDLKFTSEGHLVSAGSDGKCIVWDIGKGEPIREISPGVQRIREISLRGNDGIIAMATSDVNVILWSGAEERIIGRVRGHTTTLWAVAFSPDGKYLATLSADGRLLLWDVEKLLSLRPRFVKFHYAEKMGRTQFIGFSFFDPNGDVAFLAVDLVEGDPATIFASSFSVGLHYRKAKSSFQPLQPRTLPTEFRIGDFGEEEGFITFGLRVDKPQKLVLKLVLIDGLGLCSEIENLVIEAEG